MKRTAFISLAMAMGSILNGQSWNITLNSIGGGASPNFGTSSSHPINFYTANTQRMVLTTTGELKINRLVGTGNRFLQADPNGSLVEWTGDFMKSNELLFGDGTWRPFPFTVNDDEIYTGSGTKLGIGVSNPATALDVSGDATISGAVKAPGGFQFTTNDGFSYNSTDNYFVLGKGLSGGNPGVNSCFTLPNPTSMGWIYANNSGLATSQNNVGGSAISAMVRMFISPSNGSGYIEVDGKDNNNTNNNALYLNYNCGRNTHINTGTGTGTVYIGSSGIGSKIFMGNYVSTGNFVSMAKHLEIGDPTTGITSSPNNIALDIHANDGKGLRLKTSGDALQMLSVENNAHGSSKNSLTILGSGSTEINCFDVEALTIKENFSVNNYETIKLYSSGWAEILSQNTDALSIYNGTGPKTFNVQADGYTEIKTAATKAFAIKNASNSNNETFSIDKNGYTEIKVYSPTGMPKPYSVQNARALTIRDMTNTRDVFVVRSDGTVFAREVEISNVATFPDYVFNKEYKLMPLSELQGFINSNKHLPGFEKGEYYEKNGVNVSSIILKQQEKIEELTLYILEQEKRIQALEKNK